MSKTLTAAAVLRLRKPETGCLEVPDGGCTGLYLRLYASGKRSWILRYRRPSDGRPAGLVLGSVYTGDEVDVEAAIGGHLSLKKAHELVSKLQSDIALGRDPGKIQAEKKRAIISSDKFGGAALDFVEQHARRKTRRWEDTARLLGLQHDEEDQSFQPIKKGLADRWRDKPIAEIDGDLIHAVVEETRSRGIPGLERRKKAASESRARSMYAALSAMFGWLVDKRRLKQNPCAGVARPEVPKSRDRVLRADEIASFWKAAERQSEPFGQALKILLLTGARLNEVAGMTRSELSDDGATWTIPGERTKNHKSHVIPLPKLARDILGPVSTQGDLVFSTNGTTCISGWSKAKRRLDEAAGIPAWRLHDLRRSAATHMAELGIAPPHIIETILNHTRPGVTGIYNRAEHRTEVKLALERWAAHIEELVKADE